MSQNITLLGASYTDVPAVQLPKTGGGTAQFDDTTDANATAADIAQGKTAYVNGVKVTGTGSGGGSGVEFLWPSSINIETIGANTITNTTNAKAYFDARYSSYKYAFLLSPLTVNNQLVCTGIHTSRWRNGNIAGTTVGTSYDAKLVEGTQYVVLAQ